MWVGSRSSPRDVEDLVRLVDRLSAAQGALSDAVTANDIDAQREGLRATLDGLSAALEVLAPQVDAAAPAIKKFGVRRRREIERGRKARQRGELEA